MIFLKILCAILILIIIIAVLAIFHTITLLYLDSLSKDEEENEQN